MKCHCGKPLHYTSSATKAMVDSLIAEYGDTLLVTVDGRSWRVPRHYIALHGLKAHELPSLGFEEVRKPGPSLEVQH